MPRSPRLCLLLVLAATLAAISAQAEGPAQAEGTARSFFPTPCAQLQATHTERYGALTSELAPDTARIQAALDRCPTGQAVELMAGPAAGSDARETAFLLAPIHLPAGATLLIDAGVTVFASVDPADYTRTPALITVGPSTGPTPAGLMGFGTLDGRGSLPLLGRRHSWYDLDPAARPTLIEARGPLALQFITLRNAPADALRFTGNQLLSLTSIHIVSPATALGTRGVVVRGTPQPFALDVSTISVAGPALTGALPTAPLALYAGTGIEPALPAHNHCIASPAAQCVPATLPQAAGALFLSTPGSTNLAASSSRNLTLNAVVLPPESTIPNPQAPVTFFDGATELGATVPEASVARFPLPTLTAGTHVLTAVTAGVTLNSVTVTVAPTPNLHPAKSTPSLALSADAATLPLRSALHLIATPGPAATGTVTFFDGTTPLTTLNPDPATGQAILTTTTLSAGSHTFTASYSGDLLNPASTSQAIPVTVTPLPSAFTVAGPATAFTGQQVTFTAAGLPPDATGTVTFLDYGVPIASTTITRNTGPSYFAFGDDIPYGGGLPPPSRPYPVLLAKQFGLALTNSSAGLASACDVIANQLLRSAFFAPQLTAPVASLQASVNETWSLAIERPFLQCHQAAMAFLGIPRAFKVLAGDPAATVLSGDWQQPSATGPTAGVFAETSGAGALQFQLTSTGAPLYLWYLLDSFNQGAFTVTVDGVPSPTPVNVFADQRTNNSTGYGYAMLRLPAAAGPHTLVVTVVSGSVGILGAGTALAAGTPLHPTVLVADIPFENTATPRADPAISAQFDIDLQAEIATLAADGLDLRLIPTRQFMLGTPEEMMSPILPNPLGQQHLADAFASALATLPASSYTTYLPNTPTATGAFANDGVRTLTALYSGDGNYAPSTSSPFVVSVDGGYTSLTLLAPTSVPYNSAFALTATVTPAQASGKVTFLQGATTLGSARVVNGSASIQATLPTGAWPVSATFVSDEGRQTSISPVSYILVGRQSATISLTVAEQGLPSVAQAAVLTATVFPYAATGTITFTDLNLITLGQAPLIDGVAMLPITAQNAGTLTYLASFPGDPAFEPVTSAPVSLVPARLPVSLLAFPSAAQASYGSAVSLHVDALAVSTPLFPVAPATLAPALNATTVFMGDSITQYWPLPLNNHGIAGQTTTEMLARFSQDVLNQGFERVILLGGTNDIRLSVPPATTLANLKAMADLASAAGMRVILCTVPPLTIAGTDENLFVLPLNAAITAFAAQNGYALLDYHAALIQHPDAFLDGVHPNPAGYVLMETALAQTLTPMAGAVSLPDGTTATLSSTGTATLTSSNLSPGQPVTVTFAGDANFLPASTTASVTVSRSAPAVTLQAQALAGYTGNSVALTGTLTVSAPGAPTGTVIYMDGGTRLGTANLVSGNQTALTATNLSNGPHTFTAIYAGDPNYAPATSAPVAMNTPYSNTTLALSAPSPTYPFGAPVPLSAALTPGTATGTITFFDGATSLAQVPVANGLATYTITSLAAGPHTLTALYSGDPTNTETTSPALALNITQTPTTLTLAALPASQTAATPTPLTAAITPITATGLVTFTDTFTAPGATNATTQALGAAKLATGTATFTPTSLPVGNHVFTATYAGDPTDQPSTANPRALVVLPIASTLALTTPQSTLTYGNPATVTATLTPATATGTVTLRDSNTGTESRGTIANGSFTFNLTNLVPGAHTFLALYAGDAITTPATSPTLALTVTAAPTTISLSPLPASFSPGSPVTLTATLTPATATGTITFRESTLGPVGQANVAAGAATLTLPNLPAAHYAFTASYSGDTDDLPATTAAAVTTEVGVNSTTTTLAALPATLAYGAPLTLAATVSPAPATGALTFTDNDATLGTALLNGGAATLTTNTLTPGAHILRAIFAGGPTLQASTSPSTTLTVTRNPSTTTLSTAQPTLPAGAPLLLSVTVTGAITNPTGTVSLRAVSSASVTTNLGNATLTPTSNPTSAAALTVDTTVLGPGVFTLLATYSGDTLTSPSATTTAIPITLTRLATAATLTLSAAAVPVQTSITLSAVITGPTPAQVPTGAVTFTLGNTLLATVTLDPTGTATAVLPGQSTPGNLTLTAVYTPSGAFSASASPARTLLVTAPLTLAFTAGSVGMTPGSAGTTSLTLTPLSGFNGALTAATCTPSVKFLHCTLDAPATLSATTSATLNLSADLTTSQSAVLSPGARRTPTAPLTCAFLLTFLPLATRRRTLRRFAPLALLLLITALFSTVTGCAGNGAFGDLPAGAQSVTVTVTANGMPVQSRLTINVSQ